MTNGGKRPKKQHRGEKKKGGISIPYIVTPGSIGAHSSVFMSLMASWTRGGGAWKGLYGSGMKI